MAIPGLGFTGTTIDYFRNCEASASPFATATAEPHDEPPGISLLFLLKGLVGVPKKSLMPEGIPCWYVPDRTRYALETHDMVKAIRFAGKIYLMSMAGDCKRLLI
jgi:hypothetical protein